MLHARDDYNDRIQDSACIIPDDEPVFLIRGQDKVSASAVRWWAKLNDQAGGDPKLSRLARAQAKRMSKWPVKKAADL